MRHLLTAIAVATLMVSPGYAKTTMLDSIAPTAERPAVQMAAVRDAEGSWLPDADTGREVAAPSWSFGCMTDRGESPCNEPMWVYH
jgi:hypothetical protein